MVGRRPSQSLLRATAKLNISQEGFSKNVDNVRKHSWMRIVKVWWWEIAAATLSITCMGLLLLLILRCRNTTLNSWNFHVGSLVIQPNTLISILTTIAQTLMMIPVTACISQLKWKHFLLPRRLFFIQLMDDASRGPWGSLQLLLRFKSTKAFTASLFALVTIVALGIGPSAQQILEFRPTPGVLLTNVTAEISVASNYTSKSYLSQYGSGSGRSYFTTTYNSDMFKLQSTVLDGLAGSASQPNFVCAGESCEWSDYTSLAICGTYHNLTESAVVNCTSVSDDDEGNSIELDCTYGVPDAVKSDSWTLNATAADVSFATQNSQLSPSTTIFQSTSVVDVNDGVGILTVKVFNPNSNPIQDSSPPKTEVGYSQWRWCATTCRGDSATPSGLGYERGATTSEILMETGFVSTDSDDAGSGTIIYATPSGAEFRVDHNTQQQLFGWLSSFLERSIVDEYPHTGTQDDADGLNLSFFLYASDMAAVTGYLADTLTNQIRSTDPGDNLNATNLAGRVYVTETYIYVRWQWIVLSLAETVLTCVLLGVCVVATRNEPLLKSSVLAFLFHPLDGWKAERLGGACGLETSSTLEYVSKCLVVRFEPGESGRFRVCGE